MRYRTARGHSKRIVKTAKNTSWKTYEEELSKLCKHSINEFYKSAKAMWLRDEPFNPTTVINKKDGNPLYEEEKIK